MYDINGGLNLDLAWAPDILNRSYEKLITLCRCSQQQPHIRVYLTQTLRGQTFQAQHSRKKRSFRMEKIIVDHLTCSKAGPNPLETFRPAS